MTLLYLNFFTGSSSEIQHSRYLRNPPDSSSFNPTRLCTQPYLLTLATPSLHCCQNTPPAHVLLHSLLLSHTWFHFFPQVKSFKTFNFYIKLHSFRFNKHLLKALCFRDCLECWSTSWDKIPVLIQISLRSWRQGQDIQKINQGKADRGSVWWFTAVL